jgi:hypothetical protein
VIVGGSPWFVALYGLQAYLLPFPVAFIMGENIDTEDLRKFVNWTLLLLLPLVALEVAQYLAPPSSILNAGAGVDAGQIDYAGGHVRASATFSFATGPANYLPLATAFMFYGFSKDRFVKNWLLWASAFALILAIPITGSRTVVVLAVIIASFFGVSQFGKALKLIVPVVSVYLLLSFLPVFSDASHTLSERFANASASEGGSAQSSFIIRVLGPFKTILEDPDQARNWLGSGMGYGSNAVATLLTGRAAFLAGESEFERMINEFGMPAGLAFALFRLILGLTIALKGLAKLRTEQQSLAWLLGPFMFTAVFMGTMEQPTTGGFVVILIAFSLAALNLHDVPMHSGANPLYGRRGELGNPARTAVRLRVGPRSAISGPK